MIRSEEYDGRGKKVSVINQMSLDREINIYDEESEYSVYNLLPICSELFRQKMKQVPEEYRNMDHYELRKILKPTPSLNQLRLNFWSEYDMCVEFGAKKRRMTLNNITAGVCSRGTFKDHIRDPLKLAWILTPVQSYQLGVQDVLETCLYKMRTGLDKLEMTSVKDVNTVLKIYEAFDKRVHGDYTQRVTKEVTYKGVDRLSENEIKEKMRKLGIKNDNVVAYSGTSNEVKKVGSENTE